MPKKIRLAKPMRTQNAKIIKRREIETQKKAIWAKAEQLAEKFPFRTNALIRTRTCRENMQKANNAMSLFLITQMRLSIITKGKIYKILKNRPNGRVNFSDEEKQQITKEYYRIRNNFFPTSEEPEASQWNQWHIFLHGGIELGDTLRAITKIQSLYPK